MISVRVFADGTTLFLSLLGKPQVGKYLCLHSYFAKKKKYQSLIQ